MLIDFGVYRECDRRETEGRKEEIVYIYLFSYDVVRPSPVPSLVSSAC